jgi:hypothetical protein
MKNFKLLAAVSLVGISECTKVRVKNVVQEMLFGKIPAACKVQSSQF